jgi:hypothetical protein
MTLSADPLSAASATTDATLAAVGKPAEDASTQTASDAATANAEIMNLNMRMCSSSFRRELTAKRTYCKNIVASMLAKI